jgi:hypothetical protein
MFCLDTSAFIDAWERYYPEDVFPGVWEKMNELVTAGKIVASDEVYKEIKKNTTGVYTWAKTHKGLFVATDVPIQKEVAKIMTQFPGLVDPRRSRSGADPMVIALAMTRSFTVVTGELPSNNPAKPKIPDVCKHYGVLYCNVLGMLRALGFKFK